MAQLPKSQISTTVEITNCDSLPSIPRKIAIRKLNPVIPGYKQDFALKLNIKNVNWDKFKSKRKPSSD